MTLPRDPQERARFVAAGLRAFARLSVLWGLTPEQQAILLGASSPEQCSSWLAGDVTNAEVELRERLSHVLGIYKTLQMLGVRSDGGRPWLSGFNRSPVFGGGSPLDRMLRGKVSDLAAVRDYLDSQFEWG